MPENPSNPDAAIRALSKLQHLFQVHFIQKALFELVEQKDLKSPLLVVNHHDRYLSLSNEAHYLAVLIQVSPPLLEQVEEDLRYIFQRKKDIVHLQQWEDLTSPSRYHRLCVSQLRQQAEQNGVPGENPYLRLLDEVFSRPETL